MAPIELPDPPLSDGVIALRGFQSADVAALVDACQDPEIPRFTLVPSPYTEDHARAWLRRVAAGRMAGTRMTFAIDALGLERLELRAQEHNHASRAVAGRAGFVPVDAPVVHRPECDHFPDVFYARLRPGTTD
jgi:RimJ/RimL family protein N-acetyltransferase